MRSSEPTVSYLSINAVLEKYRLRVPSYQRQFAWREEQVDALLDDIDALGTSREGSRRFLGYLTVLQPSSDPSVLYLIDGQQRITTLSLLYGALCRKCRKLGQSYEADDLESKFLFLDYAQPETYKYLPQDYSDTGAGLEHRGELQLVYRHILAGDRKIQKDNVLANQITPAARRLLKTAEKLRLWVQKRVTKPEHVSEMLARVSLIDVVMHRVSNEAEGAEIFDGLNNRGKHLSDVEKIKSYALYLYNKSQSANALVDSIEKTNLIFESTYKVFDKYAISDDKSETQFVDSYYHCIADFASAYKDIAGSVGAYGSDSHGAESVKELLPVGILRSEGVLQAVDCLNHYLSDYPRAAEWFGDISRVQKDGCYLDYSGSNYQGEMVAISQCLKLLRRSTGAAPLVMAFRKVHRNDDEGLIKLLRYLERLMFQLSLGGRQVNKGDALIRELARETVLAKLNARDIVQRIHDEFAPQGENAYRQIYNDEELRSEAGGLAYRGKQMLPATLYAHYHWLKAKKFRVSYYRLRKSISGSTFHFVVKPTRFGNILQTHEDDRSRAWRDHPANFISDERVAFDESHIDELRDKPSIRDRLAWLENHYTRQARYFSLEGCISETWLDKKGRIFADWFVKRWSLNAPFNLPAVTIQLHDIDFDGTDISDSAVDDDSIVSISDPSQI